MRVAKDSWVYSFSREHEPVLRVTAPAQITLETKDCYGDQLRDGSGKTDIQWDHVNPAAGPVFVEGAMPGDILKVTIDRIKTADFGVACTGDEIRIIPVVDNGKEAYGVFLGRFQIPLNKMIGVIGVAPAGDAINNATPGKHGGNMDTKLIGEGAVLYLPVAAEGALFGAGDVHAIMGDGEVGGTGLEIPAEVTVTLEVIKGGAPEFPLVETEGAYAFIVSDETLDEATDKGVELMHAFLKTKLTGLSDEEISILMSLVGSTEICQIVDPLKTVRFVFPKEYVK